MFAYPSCRFDRIRRPFPSGSVSTGRFELVVLDCSGTVAANKREREVVLADGEILPWDPPSILNTRCGLGGDLWAAKRSWPSRRKFSVELSQAMLGREDRALLTGIASILTHDALMGRSQKWAITGRGGGCWRMRSTGACTARPRRMPKRTQAGSEFPFPRETPEARRPNADWPPNDRVCCAKKRHHRSALLLSMQSRRELIDGLSRVLLPYSVYDPEQVEFLRGLATMRTISVPAESESSDENMWETGLSLESDENVWETTAEPRTAGRSSALWRPDGRFIGTNGH